MLPSSRADTRETAAESKGWTERLLVGACLGAVWGIVVGFLPALAGGLSTLLMVALVGSLFGAFAAAVVHLERGRIRKPLARSHIVAAVVYVSIAPLVVALVEGRGSRWSDWITPVVVLAFLWLTQRPSRT